MLYADSPRLMLGLLFTIVIIPHGRKYCPMFSDCVGALFHPAMEEEYIGTVPNLLDD